MRQVTTRDELVAGLPENDLFARYAVPQRLDGGWVHGGAVGYLRQSHSGKENISLWGPRDDLAALLQAVAQEGVLSPALDHVSVPAEQSDLLGTIGRPVDADAWDWMATDVAPPVTPAEARLVELDDTADAAGLQRLVDEENPLSEGYPGTGRTERWIGVRDGDRIVACAAVHRLSSGISHLSGIIVASDHRGQGLGRAVTARLTRDLLRTDPVVTLGMYAGNDVARSLYHSMGYVTDKAWYSCRLDPSA